MGNGRKEEIANIAKNYTLFYSWHDFLYLYIVRTKKSCPLLYYTKLGQDFSRFLGYTVNTVLTNVL